MPVSPGASGMQPRDPCRPWRGTLASGHKPRCGLLALQSLESNPQLSFATRMEDWTCLGQHKRQPEFPVVTRESRRNSRKTTWLPRFDQLTTLDNVALAIFSREGKTRNFAVLADHDRRVRQEAEEILEQFGLGDKAGVPAGGLAQGERKLLDVAVAVALRPRLLFLDEPTSGVSTREKAPIMDIITAIVRSGRITAVIIEHDMDVVFKYSDRIVVMHQGTILAEGTPDEIRRNQQVITTLLGTHANHAG